MRDLGQSEFGGPPLERLLCPEDGLARIEAENSTRLSLYVDSVSLGWMGVFAFSENLVRECHRTAMQGIYSSAGTYRTRFVSVGNHCPPNFSRISELVREMCIYANGCHGDPFHASAYLMWRLNWIHPFYDGNGRVARELGLVPLKVACGEAAWPLASRVAFRLSEHRERYYQALSDTDRHGADDQPNLNRMEDLILDLWNMSD